MRAWGFGRLPPVGGAIDWREAREVWSEREPAQRLCETLRRRLSAAQISLHASGREALRVAFRHLAAERGRSEVVIPAYTCWSVPAAAVAAGLQVRLVDVTLRGQIDVESLARLPLERAAAVVVCNLLGVPEPIEPLRALTDRAGVAIVDDAAQSLGARGRDGPVGGRGDIGILSFARGKPLSGLGGGGLVWRQPPRDLAPATPTPRRAAALLRAAAYDLALLPWSFRALAGVPSLHIGETLYEPDFARGVIDGASVCLASARLSRLDAVREHREARAEAIALQLQEQTRFAPITGATGDCAYPRLGVVGPSADGSRDALASLAPLGVTRLYPESIDAIQALRPHCTGELEVPGARALAARLLTLPVHAGLGERQLRSLVARLAGGKDAPGLLSRAGVTR